MRHYYHSTVQALALAVAFAASTAIAQQPITPTEVLLQDVENEATVQDMPQEMGMGMVMDQGAAASGSTCSTCNTGDGCSSCSTGTCDSCGCGNCEVCDEKKMKDLKKQVATSHKGLFYDNKFDYLCDPCYCDCHLGDSLKRNWIHDNVILDIGGQFRLRYHGEHNHRGLGLTGNDDDFLLMRTRLYANMEVGSRFRFYFELIDAQSFGENLNPRPIEENHSDLLNAFADVVLWDEDCCHDSSLIARLGRQELLYGAQRLVSPLDWANTRRTFHGYKGMYQGGGWKIDGFFANTLDPDTSNFDSINEDEQFMGVYATTTNSCGTAYDLFYLRLKDEKAQGAFANDFDVHTLGGRVKGKSSSFDYEFWGAVQFGENTDGSDHSSGAFTLGIGRSFDHCWKPSLWVYYDWASGDNSQGAGNGFHHLFPLAHKYLGFMDLYGRRNIQTPNVLFTVQPHKKVKFLLWYYYFQLENINDTPYSVVLTPYNAGNAPGSRELGHELDLIMSYTISPRMQFLVGYSHFFAGDYYSNTTLVAPADGGDADFVYTQFHINF